MKRVSILCVLLAALAGSAVHAEEGGVVDKAGRGIKKGADATAHGIEKGASAAAKGIEKGVDATARGVEKGVDATGRFFKKAGTWADKKLHGSSSPSSSPAGGSK